MRRETVGSEATGPNTAGSARNMPTSAKQSPPNATASATSSRIFPGSWTARGFRHGANATDIAWSWPVLRTVSTSKTEPACETTWRPSPWTRTREYDAIGSLTWKVLFLSQPTGPSASPIVAGQEHFCVSDQPADRPPRESARLT